MAVNITITDVGRSAIVNAQNDGTAPVTISEIALGSGSYSTAPDATATALQNEIKRLTTFAGEVVADDTFHVFIKDEGNDAYSVTEFGLYLSDGTLFAIYAVTSGAIAEKVAASSLLLATDVVLTTIDATSITFGDTSFTNPPASETVKGVVELATATETQAGTDATRAVTPASLSARSATESRTGMAEVATQTETDNGTDDSRIVTPKKLNAFIKPSTDSRRGVVELATDAETITGDDSTRAVTPAGLRSARQNRVTITGTTDLNDLKTEGWFRYGGGTAPANSPITSAFFLDVVGSIYPHQIAHDIYDNRIYFRSLASDLTTWNPWEELAHTGNMPFAKALSGYQVMPGGVVVQWGRTGSFSNGADAEILFPTSFPNVCCSVVASQMLPSNTTKSIVDNQPQVFNISASSFRMYSNEPSGATGQMSFSWFAFGY